MKRFALLLLALSLGVSTPAQEATPPAEPTPRPRPAPLVILNAGNVQVEQYFTSLVQGTVGLLRLTGEGISEAQALFAGRSFVFFLPEGDAAWYALIVAPIDVQPREHPLQVLVATSDGSLHTADTRVPVISANYLRQNFVVPSERAYLINPEVERNEFARLDALTTAITPRRLWDAGGFQLPMNSPVVSAFGQYRVLNSTVQTRHTGWDQQAPTGTPVTAMASGVVVFAGVLDIRGNYVLLDHGWGIYTGYAHFSQLAVAAGQTVARGQLLGLSGNTGRSSGPHLHWEVSVSGEWIDGQAFVSLWLP